MEIATSFQGCDACGRITVKNQAMDLLEDAGIPQPRSPIITEEDRAALASMALAQRQFQYVFTFFVGMVGGAVIAYFVGYDDLVRTIFKWAISGTGLALMVSALNITKMFSFKCPRCGEVYFWGDGGLLRVFSKQCGNCGLPIVLPDPPPDDPSLDAQS
jgi:hypothetical protein